MTEQSPHVAVLMATYNGAEFLPEQLDSLATQTHENWRLWVSDDGSADATLNILRRYQESWGADKLRLFAGPRRGFQANFLELTAKPDIEADYYAWSDQDDVWLPAKLSRALAALHGQERPTLYCGRSFLTNSQGRVYNLSPLLNQRSFSFANALLQCVGGANTMVFNWPARKLIICGQFLEFTTHDWWAYQMVSGCGGTVIYDTEPMLNYRQHRGNLFGSNRGMAARWIRLRKLLSGSFKKDMDLNLKALETVRDLLTPESRRQLDALADLRRLPNPLQRLSRFMAEGFYRQTYSEQLAFCGAVLAGRL